jgi:hypothetical protein
MNMSIFDSYLVNETTNFKGFEIKQYMFPNKYGASVILRSEDYFEVAVITLGEDNELVVVTDTPITSDIMLFWSEQEVVEAILQVQKLPKRNLNTSLQHC